jgi:hypothetical protein
MKFSASRNGEVSASDKIAAIGDASRVSYVVKPSLTGETSRANGKAKFRLTFAIGNSEYPADRVAARCCRTLSAREDR